MGRILIATFSGTGNAARAAAIVAHRLSSGGAVVESVDLAAGGAIPALAAGDLLVVSSSTLGFSPPSTVIERLKAAPRSPGAKAAYLSVCGATVTKNGVAAGWSGAATVVALGILRRKGYEPIGSADASYPENWTQVSEAPFGDAAVPVLERGDSDALAFADTLALGRAVFIKRNALTLTLGRFVGFVFRLLARRALGKLYAADESCTACGLCERTCPAGAITMRGGRPAWSVDCSACNRCINVCPSASIQTGSARFWLILVLNLAAAFASGPIGKSIVQAAAPTWAGFGKGLAAFAVGLAVYAAITAVQLWPLDALLRRLERAPGIGKALTSGRTSRFRRYLAPGWRP